jgi:hypothetical protein
MVNFRFLNNQPLDLALSQNNPIYAHPFSWFKLYTKEPVFKF